MSFLTISRNLEIFDAPISKGFEAAGEVFETNFIALRTAINLKCLKLTLGFLDAPESKITTVRLT